MQQKRVEQMVLIFPLNFFLFSFVYSKMTPGKVNANENASNADQSLPTAASLQRDDAGPNDSKDVKKLTISADTDVSSTLDKSEQKVNDTTPKPKPFDEKLKLDVSAFTFI